MAEKKTQRKAPAKKPVKTVKKTQKTQKAPVRRTKKVETKKPSYAYAMAGVWLFVAAILLTIFTYGSAQGVVAGWINDAMFGLFACTAYLVPIVIFALGIYVFKVKRTNNLGRKIFLSIVEVALVGSLIMLKSSCAAKSSGLIDIESPS